MAKKFDKDALKIFLSKKKFNIIDISKFKKEKIIKLKFYNSFLVTR